MIFLQTGDFKGGKYNIPHAGSIIDNAQANLQALIDGYEKPAIYELLGVVLGDIIIAYKAVNQLPTNVHYDKIIAAFSADVSTGCGIVSSLGIKEYLKAYVFYQHTENGLVNSMAGVVNVKAEASNKTSPSETMRFAESKFNDMLNTVDAIRWYILQNKSEFPDFNGQRITVKHSNIF